MVLCRLFKRSLRDFVLNSIKFTWRNIEWHLSVMFDVYLSLFTTLLYVTSFLRENTHLER